MSEQELREAFESLETFLLLKRQNNVIYSWMELKKRNRKLANLQGSRGKSFYNPSISLKNSHIKSRAADNSNSYFLASNSQNQTPTAARKDYRLATEHYIRGKNEQVFESFNKPLKGSRYNQTQNYGLRAPPHRQSRKEESNQFEIADDEQFEDLVLDRLSKLEENINNLMREKRAKEQKRGYVGQPLTHPNPNDSFHSQIPNQQRNNLNTIQERKKAFFQSLNNQAEHRKNVIYNLKYIPAGPPSPTRPKLQHNELQQEDLINNVDYFLGNNVRKVDNINNWKSNYRVYQNSKRQNENEMLLNDHLRAGSQEWGSNSLYMNRYGVSKTSRNNQIHFLPSNIEMQTVIEHRNRFSRINKNTQHIKIEEVQKRSNPKSIASRHSEYSQGRNNLSSFY